MSSGKLAPRTSSRLRPVAGGLRVVVIEALLQAMQDALPGRAVDPERLRASLTERFERLCDGVRFDFGPVQRALERERGLTAEHIYLTYAGLAERVRSAGLEVAPPALPLEPHRRASLDQRARALAKKEAPAKKGERLGELLLRYGLITGAQLDKALRAQRAHGGRLGSHLVELGLITERSLSQFLSVLVGVPAVDLEEAAHVPQGLLASIPRELLLEHRVLPLAREGKTLRVAMVDPRDLRVLDLLAFHAGCKVDAVVAPESLVLAAFEQHFGLARAPRPRAVSVPLAQPIAEEDFEVVHTSRRREPDAAPAAPPPERGGPKIAVEDRGEFFASDRADFACAEDPLSALAADLTRATELREVLSLALKFVSQAYARAAVFALAGTEVRGLEQSGCRMNDETLGAQSFELAASTMFSRLAAEPAPRSAGVDMNAADHALLSALGMGGGRLLSLPLRSGGRVVGLVLAAGPRTGRDPLEDLECRRFVAKAELALRMLELKREILAA